MERGVGRRGTGGKKEQEQEGLTKCYKTMEIMLKILQEELLLERGR